MTQAKTEQEIDWECTWCGGEGCFIGTDTPGFDYINDDPDEIYPCPACRGSGNREDQVLW